MSESDDNDRELNVAEIKSIPAPDLPYLPPEPKNYKPPIGLIGCGGIAGNHLEAYQAKGYQVAVLCDLNLEAAGKLRDKHFPDAEVTDDAEAVFSRSDIEVVDLATHPEHRLTHIRRALESGKHVLSQKPFVMDLTEGRALVGMADERNLKLAVNQNGRWAPYFSYLRQAVKAGLLGEVVSCDLQIAWDHSWIKGTHFEEIHHIVLYDFAIHWFDIVSCVFGDRQASSVFAEAGRVVGQELDPPLGAHSVIHFDGGLATLSFQGHTKFDPAESAVVTGTRGTFRSSGPVCDNDRISLSTAGGVASIQLEGHWFNDGFAGTMGELLCAIEEDREPDNSARRNLRSLELCFAAVASADSGRPVAPGEALSVST